MRMIALLLLCQSIGSGTAVVALRSHDVLLAAVDSEENYLLYRDDGTSSVDHRTGLQAVAKAGPVLRDRGGHLSRHRWLQCASGGSRTGMGSRR